MATLKDLYELVHTLTKDEKKHVSVLISSIGGKAKERYLKAFTILNKEKAFNADSLKNKLQLEVKGMNLSEANNYVYDFICKAIISYKKSNNLGYSNQLYLIELFINRKLYKRAHYLLQKLIPELIDKASNATINRAYELQEIVNLYYAPVNNDSVFRAQYFTDWKKASEIAYKSVEILELNFKFYHLLKMIGEPRNTTETKMLYEIWKHPILQQPSSSIPFRSVKIYYIMRGALMVVLQIPGAQKYIKEEIISYRERFKKNNIAAGEVDLYDLYISMIATNDTINWNEVEEVAIRFSQLKKEIFVLSIQHRMQTKLNILTLIYFIKSKKYKEGIDCFEKYMTPKEVATWQSAPLAYMVIFYGVRLYYLNKNYNKALEYLIKMQAYEKNMRSYFLITYLFLSLLCHFKLGNYQLLDSLIISITRKLRILDKLYAPERAFLRFLKHANDVNKFEWHMHKLSETLSKYYKDPYHKIFFEYGDYKEWLA